MTDDNARTALRQAQMKATQARTLVAAAESAVLRAEAALHDLRGGIARIEHAEAERHAAHTLALSRWASSKGTIKDRPLAEPPSRETTQRLAELHSSLAAAEDAKDQLVQARDKAAHDLAAALDTVSDAAAAVLQAEAVVMAGELEQMEADARELREHLASAAVTLSLGTASRHVPQKVSAVLATVKPSPEHTAVLVVRYRGYLDALIADCEADFPPERQGPRLAAAAD